MGMNVIDSGSRTTLGRSQAEPVTRKACVQRGLVEVDVNGRYAERLGLRSLGFWQGFWDVLSMDFARPLRWEEDSERDRDPTWLDVADDWIVVGQAFGGAIDRVDAGAWDERVQHERPRAPRD